MFQAVIIQLTEILGEPDYSANDGYDKVNFQWERKTSIGDVFWVYDYKEYKIIEENEMIIWNIGAATGDITHLAKEEIEICLKQL